MPRIIDVVDHANVAQDELAWREPQAGDGDFRMGSQVFVAEGQAAVFVRDGQALDVLKTGRHTLSVGNIPGLSALIGLATSGRTPFPAQLYFVNLKDMPQVGWGTNPPIVLETPGRGLGVVLLITHGVMDIGVDDQPDNIMRFVKQYAAGRARLLLADIQDRLRSTLLGELSQILLKSGAQSVPDANRILSELEGGMLAKLNEKFQQLGLRIKAFEANPFTVKNVSIDELRDYVSMDVWERARMTSARAKAMEDAASNPGMAGTMAGAGLGFGLAQQMGAAMGGMMQPQQPQPQQQAAPAAPTNPQTREEIQALLDNLDMQLAQGKISEAVYNKMVEKWQSRLDSMK